MEATDPIDEPKKEETPQPDFVPNEEEINSFGDADEAIKEENYPSLSNQTQTGNATNNSALDIEPEGDGDDSLAHPND
ncbi:hypothetical protein [Mucilaginibacter hurinus]|nr:hypothetical protein [Mucilaginibacter hurinus]